MSSLLIETARQLEAYFDGEIKLFSLPLAPAGTAFQRRIWRAVHGIPYGATTTYGAIATAWGTSPRAVAFACAHNPLPIIVPCHRVIGAGGALTGYSAGEGIVTKAALLRLEGAIPW